MVVGTGKLPSTSPPVTIISYDLATRLGNELAVRKPNAIIVVRPCTVVNMNSTGTSERKSSKEEFHSISSYF